VFGCLSLFSSPSPLSLFPALVEVPARLISVHSGSSLPFLMGFFRLSFSGPPGAFPSLRALVSEVSLDFLSVSHLFLGFCL